MYEPLLLKNSQLEVQFTISNDLKISSLKTSRGEIFSPSFPVLFVGPHLKNKVPLPAPWQATFEGGVLRAKMNVKGLALTFRAELLEATLQMSLSVVSEADSLVGLSFSFPRESVRSVKMEKEVDLTLRSVAVYRPTNFLEGIIQLVTTEGPLSIRTSCQSAENSWLWESSGEAALTLTPVSAEDPFAPNLTVSTIDIALQIG